MFRSAEKTARNEFYSLKNTDQLNNRLQKMYQKGATSFSIRILKSATRALPICR